MKFRRNLVLVALTCVLAVRTVMAAEPRRRVKADLTMCSGGAVPSVLHVNDAICLRQHISLAALPASIAVDDLEITSLNVTIADVPQRIRGAYVDASTSTVVFTMQPQTTAAATHIETALTLGPKSDIDRLAGYYDIVWYDLEVVWPTFFGAADTSVGEEEEEEEEEEETESETTFTPFPCTHFIGELFCTNRTWLSG